VIDAACFSQVGSPGPQGIDGSPVVGSVGPVGNTGSQGVEGIGGSPGPQGVQGNQGQTGAIGSPGPGSSGGTQTLLLTTNSTYLIAAMMFGSSGFFVTHDPVTIFKMDLRNMRITEALALPEISHAVSLAPSGDFAYIASSDTPATVVRINVFTPEITFVSSATLPSYDKVQCAVADSTFVYLGTGDGEIVKVNGDSLSFVTDIKNPGFDITTGLIVSTNAYFAAYTGTQMQVLKISLQTFTSTTSAILPSSTTFVWASFASSGFGYFGTASQPAQVIKISLSDMTITQTLTLPNLDNWEIRCATTDGTYGYFGTGDDTSGNVGGVMMVRLSDMTFVGECLMLFCGCDGC